MALTMTTVTGPVFLPNGATPLGGRVSFELSSWDVEDSAGLVITGPVYVPIDENGQFTVQLFTTTAGTESVTYRMFVIWEDSTLAQSYVNDIYVSHPTPHYTKKFIGSFVLSGPGPYKLSELDIVSEVNNSSFDAYLEMKAYANRIDLGALDAAVAETNQNRILSENAASTASNAVSEIQNTVLSLDPTRVFINAAGLYIVDGRQGRNVNHYISVNGLVYLDCSGMELNEHYHFFVDSFANGEVIAFVGEGNTFESSHPRDGYTDLPAVSFKNGASFTIVRIAGSKFFVHNAIDRDTIDLGTIRAVEQLDGTYTLTMNRTISAGTSSPSITVAGKTWITAGAVPVVSIVEDDDTVRQPLKVRAIGPTTITIHNPNAVSVPARILIQNVSI